jgi:FtsH-binding integral membrane protein
MPGCPYFIANTFAHLLGGLFVTGISTENPLFQLENKPMTHLAIILILFAVTYAVLAVEPGPTKYGLYALLSIIMGQVVNGFAERLSYKGHLSNALWTVAAVFTAMSVLGLLDPENSLAWGIYLWGGLTALLVVSLIGTFFSATSDDKETRKGKGKDKGKDKDKEKDKGDNNSWSVWIGRIIILLFTLYVGFDIQILKINAEACKENPDYINESINLYVDILNIFTGLSMADGSN